MNHFNSSWLVFKSPSTGVYLKGVCILLYGLSILNLSFIQKVRVLLKLGLYFKVLALYPPRVMAIHKSCKSSFLGGYDMISLYFHTVFPSAFVIWLLYLRRILYSRKHLFEMGPFVWWATIFDKSKCLKISGIYLFEMCFYSVRLFYLGV